MADWQGMLLDALAQIGASSCASMRSVGEEHLVLRV